VGVPASDESRARRSHKKSSVVGASFLCLSLVATFAISSTASASSNINSDRSKIAQLEAQIAAEGSTAQELVSRYDAALGKEQAIKATLAITDRHLSMYLRAKTASAKRLRSSAIETYVFSGSTAGAGSLLGVPSTESDAANVYANVATGQLDTAITSFEVDAHLVSSEQSTLKRQQLSVESVLKALVPDQQAAERAISKDDALLSSVKNNLQVLIAAQARHEAAERAETERAIAKDSVSVATVSNVQLPKPSDPPTTSGGSGYENPLRGVGGLSNWRIDQGVDYGGFGPVFAVGDGVVLSTVNGGWPGGTFITYRLENGPAAGLVVYVAEDLIPRVSVGESVNTDTVLGTMYGGPNGIETGWADGGQGDTMAMIEGQFNGYNSTAFGLNFSQLLESLGAPGGVLEGGVVGGLPPNWPTW
jgi:murein DD-endopeptidase MepM/ murein hydrolase activator NlpD